MNFSIQAGCPMVLPQPSKDGSECGCLKILCYLRVFGVPNLLVDVRDVCRAELVRFERTSLSDDEDGGAIESVAVREPEVPRTE